jgi:hypothetical protein
LGGEQPQLACRVGLIGELAHPAAFEDGCGFLFAAEAGLPDGPQQAGFALERQVHRLDGDAGLRSDSRDRGRGVAAFFEQPTSGLEDDSAGLCRLCLAAR